MTKLCLSCSVKRDHGQGWVFCPYRRVWLNKGYSNCKGFQRSEETQEAKANE